MAKMIVIKLADMRQQLKFLRFSNINAAGAVVQCPTMF